MNLQDLQIIQKDWVTRNFPNRPSYQPLLGVVEEVGELSHSHLKMEQGIRGTKEEHLAKISDAVGDTVIFLSDYCTAMSINFGQAVADAWEEIKDRNWQKFPKNGRTE